jgi:hypothetical protein
MDVWVAVTYAGERAGTGTTESAAGAGHGPGHDPSVWTATFARWLSEDRRTAGGAAVRRERSVGGDGAMGPDAVEWIGLAVSAGSFLVDLVAVYGDFRPTLPGRLRRGARLVVEHRGARVVIEDGTPEDAARLVRALEAGDRPAGGRPAGGAEADGPGADRPAAGGSAIADDSQHPRHGDDANPAPDRRPARDTE